MATKYVTISIKVPYEIKEKLEKSGVKPGKIAKEAILKALEDLEIEEVRKSLRDIHDILNTISEDKIVRNIREDREA